MSFKLSLDLSILEDHGPIVDVEIFPSQDVLLAAPYRKKPVPQPIKCQMLIDTGTFYGHLRKDLIESLQLRFLEDVDVSGTSGEVEERPAFCVPQMMLLGSKFSLAGSLIASLLQSDLPYQGLIGRQMLRDFTLAF